MIDLFKQEGEFMIADREGESTFATTHGVNTTISLAPALILFGPNDSGKTNTLLSILCLIRGEDMAPRDLFRQQLGRSPGELSVLLDFERLDHRALLLDAAQRARSLDGPCEFPEFYFNEEILRVRESDQEEVPEDTIAADFVVSSLRHALLERVVDSTGTEADSEAIVEVLTRCARLTFKVSDSFKRCISYLNFKDPVPLASRDLDLDALARACEAVNTGTVGLNWGLRTSSRSWAPMIWTSR